MKIVTLTDNFGQTHKDVFYLENMQDFDEFKKLSMDTHDDEVALALKTDIPESKWDHVFDGSLGGMQVGVITAFSAGYKSGNPIYVGSEILNRKFNRIGELIEQGDIVIVNQRGGYFPINDSLGIEIIESKEYIKDKNQYIKIKEDTKIINLENDLHLEPVAVRFMKKRDPNFSTIRKLKLFSVKELVKIFKKFKENGGELAYIYTTGIGIEQMYEYTNALICAGIKTIHFQFNSGIDDKIKQFLNTIKSSDIELIVDIPEEI